MVGAVMAEFQFKGLPSQSQSANLMPKANPENRDVPDHFANVFNGVPHGLRIARSVRKEDTVGLHRQNVFGGGLRRHDVHLAIVVHEQPQNVLLNPVVIGDYAVFPRLGFRV